MSAAQVVVVPVGGSNFGSLRRALQRLGVDPVFSTDPARLGRASHVILPGVGAAAPALAELRSRGLDRLLRRLGRPLLGICLGMQLLFEASEEGGGEALGLLPGRVERLPAQPVWPHMGWNTLRIAAPAHALLAALDDSDWFYFVHGYAAPVDARAVATSAHGRPFAAVVACDQVFGCQFHPEKSAAAGRRVLENFLTA